MRLTACLSVVASSQSFAAYYVQGWSNINMHGAKLTDANLSNQFFDENSMSANEGGSFFEGANFTRAIRYGA